MRFTHCGSHIVDAHIVDAHIRPCASPVQVTHRPPKCPLPHLV